jgi:NAD-dependent DNA ligase
MEARGVSEQTVKKIYNAGYTTMKQFLEISEDHLAKLDRMGPSSAKNIATSIRGCVQDCELHRLMCASGFFGRGIGLKKMEKLTEKYPNILHEKMTLDKLKLCGFDKLGIDVVNGLEKFKEWLPTVNVKIKKIKSETKQSEEVIDLTDDAPQTSSSRKSSSKLAGQIVVFTGPRDKSLEQQIKELGGTVGTVITGKTTILVARQRGNLSTKELAAEERGIKIMTHDEFRDVFL